MLSGKVALVTGAERGLGLAISDALVRAGAHVAMLGRGRESLAQTAARLSSGPGEAFALTADVSREAEVIAAFQQLLKRRGRLDLLVNNAGIAGPTAPVAEITLEDWDRVLAVNLTGAFLCAREAAKIMVPAARGKIINISSIAGTKALALRSPYSSSKWGMIGLTRTLALELGPRNVQVNAICPGAVEGERMDRVIESRAKTIGLSPEEIRKQFVSSTALGRFVNAQDIADLVLFLASPSGDNITGQALEVNAGAAL